MSEHETILCPIDFSAASGAAVERALSLVMEAKGQLHLVHATPLPPFGLDEDPGSELIGSMRDAGREQLDAFLEDVNDRGIPIAASVREADPAHVIHEVARDPDVKLIVMGSNGRRGLDRFLLGSVTARVVQGAPVPVLVVREEAEHAGQPMRSILMATDFSEESMRVEPIVAMWARRFNAEVEVIHVVRETAVLFAPYAVVGSSDFEGELYEASTQRMKKVLERLSHYGVEAKSRIVYGHPEEEILTRAESTNVDLIAMGTRGYAGFSRVMLGSVAQRVIAHAPCNVVVAGASAQEPAEPEATREARSESPPAAYAVDDIDNSESEVHQDEFPTAEELTSRLFSLVMTGVLSVILFMVAIASQI